MGGACSRLCWWLVQRSYHADDNADTRALKQLVVPMYAFVGCVCLGILMLTVSTAPPSVLVPVLFTNFGSLGIICSTVGLLLCGLAGSIVFNSVPPTTIVKVVLTLCTVGIICMDWLAIVRGNPRTWALMVCIMDVLLVTNAPQRTQTALIVCLLSWLALERLESTARFGLYEASAWGPSKKLIEEEGGPTICTCASPPCSLAPFRAIHGFVGFAVVFMVDYWFTRGFARESRQAITTAQQIAECLGRMDTDSASALVDGAAAAALPPPLRAAFHDILAHLNTWRETEEARRRELEEAEERRQRRVVADADRQSEQLGHPMVLCPAGRFVNTGRLMSYEELRDAGALTVIDTERRLDEFRRQNTIIFLSHQWLAWGIPDPDNVHYDAMRHAVQCVVARCPGKANTPAAGSLEGVFVWVDFCSIAQEHRGMQLMAVSALPVYAAQADAFVVIAPAATHKQLNASCNLDTYNMRGWCRAEMLSKVLGSGLRNFFVLKSSGGDIEQVTDEWLDRLQLSVFDGDFSCCAIGHRGTHTCDKEALMPAILGLYGLVLKRIQRSDPSGTFSGEFGSPGGTMSLSGSPLNSACAVERSFFRVLDSIAREALDSPRAGTNPEVSPRSRATRSPDKRRATSPRGRKRRSQPRRGSPCDSGVRRMLDDKLRFFPPSFTFRSHEGWEENRELFGVMVEMMEEHVTGPQSQRPSPMGRRSSVGASAVHPTCGGALQSQNASPPAQLLS